jgi:hypothetical protein
MSKQPTPPEKNVPHGERTKEEALTLRPAPGLEIARSQILGRYWDLANLGAEVTKGNIMGQLKALDSLCEELVPAPVEKHKNPLKRMRSLDVYRSGWMGGS